MSEHPLPLPLARHQVEAILYLADRIAFVDLNISPTEKAAVHLLAEHAGEPEFRNEAWYERLSDEQACQRLDSEAARVGALVVLRYIVRCDSQVDAAECEYFQRLLDRLHVDSVQIPKDLAHHQRVALAYVGKS
jgi:uncharacterized tellurite resistance protein B-like protein